MTPNPRAADPSDVQHDAHVAHHFADTATQAEAGKLGMWLFLATEILLFGGLFCAYAVYRSNHPEIFVYAHRFLDTTLGGVNTLVLIFSSFTMALAVRAAQLGHRRALVGLLATTIACGFVFLGIKLVEYEHKWKEGLLWGARYSHVAELAARPAGEVPIPTPKPGSIDPNERSEILPAAPGPEGLARVGGSVADEVVEGEAGPPKNVQTFFAIYFLMTGLHGIHVIAGMVLLGIMLVRARRGAFGPAYYTPVDLAGLYWHLVDLIWIYLFPLLYLIH